MPQKSFFNEQFSKFLGSKALTSTFQGFASGFPSFAGLESSELAKIMEAFLQRTGRISPHLAIYQWNIIDPLPLKTVDCLKVLLTTSFAIFPFFGHCLQFFDVLWLLREDDETDDSTRTQSWRGYEKAQASWDDSQI